MSSQAPTSAEIQSWSVAYLAKALELPAEKVNPSLDVDSLGLDSTTAVAYMMSLEEWLGVELMPELLFEYPTVASLSDFIAKKFRQ